MPPTYSALDTAQTSLATARAVGLVQNQASCKRWRSCKHAFKILWPQLLSRIIAGNRLNSSPPGQNGRHFPDNIFKGIFLNENAFIPIKISLKFIPNGPISNIPALVQIMAWCWQGAKPLSEPMLTWFTDICTTRGDELKNFITGKSETLTTKIGCFLRSVVASGPPIHLCLYRSLQIRAHSTSSQSNFFF